MQCPGCNGTAWASGWSSPSPERTGSSGPRTPSLRECLCTQRVQMNTWGLTGADGPQQAPLQQSLACRCAGAPVPPTSRGRPRRSRSSPRSPPGTVSRPSRGRGPAAVPGGPVLPLARRRGPRTGRGGGGSRRSALPGGRASGRPRARPLRRAGPDPGPASPPTPVPSRRSRPPSRSPDGPRDRSPARAVAATPGVAAGDAPSHAPGRGEREKRLLPGRFV